MRTLPLRTAVVTCRCFGCRNGNRPWISGRANSDLGWNVWSDRLRGYFPCPTLGRIRTWRDSSLRVGCLGFCKSTDGDKPLTLRLGSGSFSADYLSLLRLPCRRVESRHWSGFGEIRAGLPGSPLAVSCLGDRSQSISRRIRHCETNFVVGIRY